MVASVLALASLFAVSCGKPTRHVSYRVEELRGRSLPVWQVTNAIPLAPDKAVLAAIHHLASENPNTASWTAEEVRLEQLAETWVYTILLRDNGVKPRREVVRVLLDGQIWRPSPATKTL